MWLDCSECAEVFEADAPPKVCPTCGTAGGVFPAGTLPPVESLSSSWIEAGLERAKRALEWGSSLAE